MRLLSDCSLKCLHKFSRKRNRENFSGHGRKLKNCVCVGVCWRHDCHHQLQPGILYFEDRYDDIPALSCILTVKLANSVAEQIQPCSCRYCHQYFSPAVGNLTRKEIKEFSAGVSRTY